MSGQIKFLALGLLAALSLGSADALALSANVGKTSVKTSASTQLIINQAKANATNYGVKQASSGLATLGIQNASNLQQLAQSVLASKASANANNATGNLGGGMAMQRRQKGLQIAAALQAGGAGGGGLNIGGINLNNLQNLANLNPNQLAQLAQQYAMGQVNSQLNQATNGLVSLNSSGLNVSTPSIQQVASISGINPNQLSSIQAMTQQGVTLQNAASAAGLNPNQVAMLTQATTIHTTGMTPNQIALLQQQYSGYSFVP